MEEQSENPADPDDVPVCGTGPAGRMRFVVREIRRALAAGGEKRGRDAGGTGGEGEGGSECR